MKYEIKLKINQVLFLEVVRVFGKMRRFFVDPKRRKKWLKNLKLKI